MTSTYRAMQVARPGVLEMTERTVPEPGPGEVLIAVQACGMCGADVADIDGHDPRRPPRVPGHEVVGRIAALGPGVPARWSVGQRVGAGRLGGHCHECGPCRQGRFQLCRNQEFTGATRDGGYAEMMLARHTGLAAIPPELDAQEAAPLLCAGLATFNALKRCGAQAGDLVAVLGMGGLGHMALQYARAMGFRVAALGRGGGVAADAIALGAHLHIDTNAGDAVEKLAALGGAQAMISTIPAIHAAALMRGLAPGGCCVLLGAGPDPLPLAAGHLVAGERSLRGSLTGTPHDAEKTLDFSLLAGIRPLAETLPLADANEAYRRMKSGQARFRMVLTMEHADIAG